MKILYTCAVLLASLQLAVAESPLAKANTYYQQGLAAEKSGDPSAAIAAYRNALAVYPRHAHARYRAGQVKIHAKEIRAANREKVIGAIMIPTYQIEDASFGESIDLLRLAIMTATEEKVSPNFIIKDPKNQLTNRSINVNLKNIPVKAILSYLQSETGVKIRFDEHAIVILKH